MGNKSPGQIAFEAYNKSKGGLTYDGKPIPPWDTLTDATGQGVQAAWESAAESVIDIVHAALDRAPDVLIQRARRAVENHSGKSRESSLCLTKLDEAAMWHAQIPTGSL